ncbi:autotransporter-associated beta strand repeat-containing protein [Limnohabitans sp. T6-20]|uniref:two-partner secretion domain-containing protein n=1 Tax=Limnohabitans sp. T6-20 TaxID=1100725 RepID=UPI000D34814F|nr:autotransporter-associated beta strand repeat-containing protein [Limnohabitans sp. T6-20]PUE10298.1 hypothetical protein B9Z33_09415 [Limnohabitans sp. T6-20]
MNANCFKTVFSERLGCLIAVGEHACSQGKSSGESAFGSSFLASAGVFTGALLLSQVFVGLAWAQPAANALPTGGAVVQGAASMAQSANQLNITQASQRAAINWQSFDIGAAAKVNVVQPNAQAVLLNRVVGQSPSQIFGQLQANGHVILVNPNGVLFGKDGSVNAGSFTASTLGITDADFMAGNMVYQRNGSTAGVVNQGTIEVSPGGYVALLGASVSNEGKIIAPKGGVALGAAETIKVPLSGSGRIKLELTAGDINASVKNSGSIVSEGGQVYMQALALNRAAAQVIQSGSIDTTGEQGGAVHLLVDGGTIKVDGSITANSTGTDDKGQVRKGGDIVIGRDEETGALAKVTDVSGALLETQKGFVETSGHDLRVDDLQVKASNWLLDPDNIDITGDATAATTGYSKIKASAIVAALNAGTSVTVSTTATSSVHQPAYSDTAGTGAGAAVTGDGNILVNAAIVKSGASDASLTLLADNGITVHQRIGKASADITSTGKLDVTLTASGNAAVATDSRGLVLNSFIDANGGVVTISGTNVNTNGSSVGVTFNNGSGITAGSYTVQGVSTSTAQQSYGVGMFGTVKFKSTGDSLINGTSLAQSTAMTYGTTISDGANVSFDAGNAGGKLVVKGSNAAWETGLRISAVGGSATVTTDGLVTLGALEANSQFSFRAGTITANSGSLTLFGQMAGGGTALSTYDGSSITANNGTSITMEGKITGTNTGTAVGLGQNSSLTMQALQGTAASAGDIKITGTATNGTGVYIKNASNTTWRGRNIAINGLVNTAVGGTAYGVFFQRYASIPTFIATGNISVEGTVQGAGSGTGLTFEISGWGGQATSMTASGDITLRGNNRASTANTRNAVYIASGLQAVAGGNLVLQGETNNAATTAINVVSNAASSWGTSLYGNMTLQATGNVLVQSNQGSIVLSNQLASTYTSGALTTETKITGHNITIDNTGAGMATGAGTAVTGTGGTQGATLGSGNIDAATGVITRGAGKSTSSTAGVRLTDGRAITAKNNINIFGAGTTGNGVEISGAAALSANVAGYTGNINIAGENTNATVGNAAINISNASATITALNYTTLTSSGVGSGTSLVAAGNITVGGELQVENLAAGTISGVIGGTGMLRKRGGTGAGTLTLTGENTYTGGTTANGGMLQVGNGGTTGTLGVGGAISVGAALSFKRSNTLEISQNINGVGQISQIGTGTTILSGTNSYSGTTTISSGGLQIGHSGTTGTLGAGAVSVASGANLSFKRSGTWTVANAISGAGNLTQEGSGTTVLTGANIYTGTTTISAGALQIGDGGTSGALGLGAVVNNASLIFNRSNALTIANAISGSGGLIQQGTGTTVLSADNSYGGTTVVSGGTLQVGNAGATGTLGAGAVTLSNNANLSYVRSADTTIANNISGVGSLSASITGVGSDLTIANAVALTGGTVNLAADGHLTVTQTVGTSNATSSAVVMTSGKATSAGTASGGDISFSGSGGVSVGASGRATLYTGSLTGSTGLGIVAGNSRYNSDELASNYTSALGTGVYAVYREAPTLSINVNNASKTYDGVAFGGGNGLVESGATGLKNGDSLSSALSSAVWSGAAQNAVNAGTYTLSASESIAGKSALGYVTTYNDGALNIAPKSIAVTGITVDAKPYDGNAVARISAASFSGLVPGESLGLSGAGFFDSPNVNGVSLATVPNVGQLTRANGTGDWGNYSLSATGAVSTSAIGKITPVALTARVNDSAVFVTQSASAAPDMGVAYTGFVNGESASSALSGLGVRTYSGATDYPTAGSYTGVYGLSAVPTANHGNYSVSVIRGALTVVPADKLLIRVDSQTSAYGQQSAAVDGVASPGTVGAYYCLDAALACNGANLVSLNLTRLSSNRWKAADSTGSFVVFDTAISGASYSTGGYLNVGNYRYTTSEISPLSLPNGNFSGRFSNAGVLTVDAQPITASYWAADKRVDGTVSAQVVSTTSGFLAGDQVSDQWTRASFATASVGNYQTVSVNGVQLLGADRTNYRLVNPLALTTASILPIDVPEERQPARPQVKPVVLWFDVGNTVGAKRVIQSEVLVRAGAAVGFDEGASSAAIAAGSGGAGAGIANAGSVTPSSKRADGMAACVSEVPLKTAQDVEPSCVCKPTPIEGVQLCMEPRLVSPLVSRAL